MNGLWLLALVAAIGLFVRARVMEPRALAHTLDLSPRPEASVRDAALVSPSSSSFGDRAVPEPITAVQSDDRGCSRDDLRSITGVVLDENDTPRAFAWITVRIAGQLPGYLDAVGSLEGGRFEITGLEPAVYELLVDRGQAEPQRFESTTIVAVDCRLASRTDVVVRPTPFEGQPVTGRLRGIDPDEIGWTLQFVPHDSDAPCLTSRKAFVEGGRFSISLAAGRYAVILGHAPPRRVQDIEVLPGGGSFEFEVPTGVLAGRVSKALGVRAILVGDPCVEDIAEGPARSTGWPRRADFRFTSVEPGRWAIVPDNLGRTQRSFRPLLVDVAPGQKIEDLELEVVEAHRLDLRISPGPGVHHGPVPRTSVTLYVRTAAGELLTPDGVNYEPDDMWLPPGDFELTLVAGRYVAGPVSVRVGEPNTRAPAPVEFILRVRSQ